MTYNASPEKIVWKKHRLQRNVHNSALFLWGIPFFLQSVQQKTQLIIGIKFIKKKKILKFKLKAWVDTCIFFHESFYEMMLSTQQHSLSLE